MVALPESLSQPPGAPTTLNRRPLPRTAEFGHVYWPINLSVCPVPVVLLEGVGRALGAVTLGTHHDAGAVDRHGAAEFVVRVASEAPITIVSPSIVTAAEVVGTPPVVRPIGPDHDRRTVDRHGVAGRRRRRPCTLFRRPAVRRRKTSFVVPHRDGRPPSTAIAVTPVSSAGPPGRT